MAGLAAAALAALAAAALGAADAERGVPEWTRGMERGAALEVRDLCAEKERLEARLSGGCTEAGERLAEVRWQLHEIEMGARGGEGWAARLAGQQGSFEQSLPGGTEEFVAAVWADVAGRKIVVGLDGGLVDSHNIHRIEEDVGRSMPPGAAWDVVLLESAPRPCEGCGPGGAARGGSGFWAAVGELAEYVRGLLGYGR